ncbi:hypothetical protein BKA70DRAFT_1269303 [Coprinopsis sp. MPI-PUGE-AT-0042]|nr:hypothetical protein BKA70DRAFT_1269303 [Coprinopsis sp. MPI-PUGE-AT-0042]
MSTSLHSLLDIFSCFLYFASIHCTGGVVQANAGFGLALCPIGVRGENCPGDLHFTTVGESSISSQALGYILSICFRLRSIPFSSSSPPSPRIVCNDLTDPLAYVYTPDCIYVATVNLASPTYMKRPPLV